MNDAANTDEGGSLFYVLDDAKRIVFLDDDSIMREFATVNPSTVVAKVAADGARNPGSR